MKNMIQSFLEKYQEELTLEKIELTEHLTLLNGKIKEDEKFISVLEVKNDDFYTELTPRDVNLKNKGKIEAIKQSLCDTQDDREQLIFKIKKIEERLTEVQELLSNMKKDNLEKEKIEITGKEELINKLNDILTFLPADPMRARIEIVEILKNLS